MGMLELKMLGCGCGLQRARSLESDGKHRCLRKALPRLGAYLKERLQSCSRHTAAVCTGGGQDADVL